MMLNAALWLMVSLLGPQLISSSWLSPYFTSGSGTLLISVSALIGVLVFWILAGSQRTDRARLNFMVVVVFSGLIIGLAFIRQLDLRGPTGQPVGIHDGAVQTEVAASFLLDGKNPYAADYSNTKYAIINPPIPGGPAVNVVWSHYIYPPLPFVLQVPWSALGRWLHFVADARWLTLAAFVVTAGILIQPAKDWTKRTTVAILTLGNPLLWTFALAGQNDFYPALGLVGATLAIRAKRWWLAGITFGLALTAKQSVWMLVPLVIVWLWARYRRQALAWKPVLWGAVASSLAIIGPFLLWGPTQLYDDIIRYASGSIPFSYPISGSTLLQYLHVSGLLASPWAIVPTAWFQLAVGVPLFWVLGRRLWTQPTASQWLLAASILMLGVLLVSRYVNLNYFVTLEFLVLAAWILQPPNPHVST